MKQKPNIHTVPNNHTVPNYRIVFATSLLWKQSYYLRLVLLFDALLAEAERSRECFSLLNVCHMTQGFPIELMNGTKVFISVLEWIIFSQSVASYGLSSFYKSSHDFWSRGAMNLLEVHFINVNVMRGICRKVLKSKQSGSMFYHSHQ